IRVENFNPNMTSHVHCDRASYIQRAINGYDTPEIAVSEIYDIDQLEAIKLAAKAWAEIDATCWRKTGILTNEWQDSPPTSNIFVPISSLVSEPSFPSPAPNVLEDPIAVRGLRPIH
ncbi:hypothetical protein BXZ70DRAFT_901812, partial [Cristinia sonorae]